jgi:hypothetical protein
MKKLLITGWAGTEHGMMAAHTAPIMEAYAAKHGADFYMANLIGGEPASWIKIPYIMEWLRHVDLVAWVDADVVITERGRGESIFDAFDRDAWQAVVLHKTECGLVPNCGVWVVAKPMLPILTDIWAGRGRFLNHPWWEQAAVMEQMGFMPSLNTAGWPYSVDAGDTELRQYTQFLDAKWNDHPRNAGRVESPNFIHVTQYDDRLGTIRRLCAH